LNGGRDALDLVEIQIPCQVPWNSMPGDELVRHCGTCKQNVYNVSSYTRAEAMKFLRARACLRIYRRSDNTVVTSDCRERLRAARKRGLLIFAGALVVVLWAQICAQFVGLWNLRRVIGCRPTPTTAAPEPIAAPGQIALPPPRPMMHVQGPPPKPVPWPPVPQHRKHPVKKTPPAPKIESLPTRGLEIRVE
jgi:hypothetical protein